MYRLKFYTVGGSGCFFDDSLEIQESFVGVAQFVCRLVRSTPYVRMRYETSSLFPILRPENGKDLRVVY